MKSVCCECTVFFFNDTATTEIYTLSLHDALPILTVAYIPNKKLLGLSKIARICDMVGKRLQLQERIGRDIAEIMQKVTNSKDIAVLIQGKHSCMTMRGIKKQQSITETSCCLGKFKENLVLQNRLYQRL